MNIKDLYWILATGHLRLPYWSILMIIVVFFVVFLVLLATWKLQNKYKRQNTLANNRLKKSQDEKSAIVFNLKAKEEKIVQLSETITSINKKLSGKETLIKSLNKKISALQDVVDNNITQHQAYESEKSELLLEIEAKEKQLAKLNDTITLANESIQRGEEEKCELMKRFNSTQEILSQKIKLIEILEEKFNQEKCQYKELEKSKKLKDKELDELRKTLQEQINTYKSEIKNLNSKLERRDEKIAKLNDSLTQINKELQTVLDEKSQIEITLEDIQKKQMEKEENMHTDKSQNIIEKIAKW